MKQSTRERIGRLRKPIFGTVALLILVVVATGDWLDRSADGYYEAAFKRALVTFAVARAINGVISVIQGTELAVQPAGVGVTFTPGEIVDPINDLIERFSWVMLASTTSLGMQKVLMDISAWTGMRIIVIVAVVIALGIWWWRPRDQRARRWALRLVLLAAFLRLAMPLMVVLNNAIYDIFMDQTYQESTLAVERAGKELEYLAREEQVVPEDESWTGSMRRWLGDTASSLDVRQRMAAYQERFANAVEHILRLSALFLLQTVVFPLLFLWLLARAIGSLARYRGRIH